jgi:AcrR family transcriptional regulator
MVDDGRPLSALSPEPDVRSLILASATRLFAAHGFDGTSLQLIAEEVGIRKPSLLHHFPSKEELRQSVFDQILSHWNDVLPRLLLAATASTRFDSVMEELTRFFVDDPDRARLLVREVLDRPAQAKALLVSRVRPWVAAIADYIRKGQEHGDSFPDADAETYVVHILRLVIATVATADTFGVLLYPGETPPMGRQMRELLRIARASLFREDRGGHSKSKNRKTRR